MNVPNQKESRDNRRQHRSVEIVRIFLEYLLEWESFDEDRIFALYRDSNPKYVERDLCFSHLHDPLSYFLRYLRQEVFIMYRERGVSAAKSQLSWALDNFTSTSCQGYFKLNNRETESLYNSLHSLMHVIERYDAQRRSEKSFCE